MHASASWGSREIPFHSHLDPPLPSSALQNHTKWANATRALVCSFSLLPLACVRFLGVGSKRAARRRHPGPAPDGLAFGSILPGELLFPASIAGRAIHSFAFRGLGGASAERHYDDCTPKYRARSCLHFLFGSVSRRTHQEPRFLPMLAFPGSGRCWLKKEGIAHTTARTPHSEMRVLVVGVMFVPNSTNTLAEQSLPISSYLIPSQFQSHTAHLVGLVSSCLSLDCFQCWSLRR